MTIMTWTEEDDSYTHTGSGDFTLEFLGGNDTLVVNNVSIYDTTIAEMGAGDDRVTLKAGLAIVTGGLGNDRFDVYAEAAKVDGGDGNDLFNHRADHHMEYAGGAGNDRFNFYSDATNGPTIDAGAGDDDFFGYGHTVFGDLYGGDGRDYFVGFGGPGANLYGGAGNDIYRADPVWQAVFVEHADEGTDSVQVARGAHFTLGANIENISVQGFSGSTDDSPVLSGNELNNTINAHANHEALYGNGGDDILNCKGGDDYAYGGTGNDRLDGGNGNDHLYGDEGNDILQGRAGDDTMTGGLGDDTYYVDSLGDDVHEAPGEGVDLVRVAIDGYTLEANVENGIVFGAAGLALNGNDLGNVLIGNAGNDTFHGAAGNDTLKGGAGADQLFGGDGDDFLVGGAGVDQLSGGAGSDTFQVNEIAESALFFADQILDFEHGVDTIDLSNIDANSQLDGIQDFVFAASKPADSAGAVWVVNGQQPGTYQVAADTNGDGFVDFSLTVISDAPLDAGDFLF